jgi:hypothetical protein
VLWRTAPGYLVLSTVDGVPIEVLGPGADVWEALDRPRALDDIVGQLAPRYDVDPSRMTADVAGLLDQLSERGFVSETVLPGDPV